ncbi:MAG TPA: TauD/TfdA family dioxygenase [Actinopolymorphaceae bacterium]
MDSTHGKANSWHTDVTFVDRIPAISLLRAVQLPTHRGTTVWANTVLGYETLRPALKALVERLWAVHTNLYDYVAGPTSQAGSACVRTVRLTDRDLPAGRPRRHGLSVRTASSATVRRRRRRPRPARRGCRSR